MRYVKAKSHLHDAEHAWHGALLLEQYLGVLRVRVVVSVRVIVSVCMVVSVSVVGG